MAAVRHVFVRSVHILVIYLVLGNLLNPSFALRLDDGTDCCSALVVSRELNSFSPPKLSMRRKVADKRHLHSSGFLLSLRFALSSLLEIFYSHVCC